MHAQNRRHMVDDKRKIAGRLMPRGIKSRADVHEIAQSCELDGGAALQMTAIGEESGSLDSMLSKVADYFEREADETVDALASLIEPMIMVVLGVIIGGIVIAIYLPIFKLGQVV